MRTNKSYIFFKRHNYLLITAAWLITISFIIDNYWSGTSTITAVTKTIQKDIQKKQKHFDAFCKDTSLIKNLSTGQYSNAKLEELTGYNYYIFIYRQNQFTDDTPVFWNTQVVQPDTDSIGFAGKSKLVKLANGWYVINKQIITLADSVSLKLISLIPVKWDFYIQNKYIQNSFAADEDIDKEYDLSLGIGTAPVKSIDGKTLFYIHPITANIIHRNNSISLLFKILASLLLLFFIHIYANYIVVKKGLWQGILSLVIPVLVLRIASYFLPIPFNFRQFNLFDPAIYGSTNVLRSLGDLLINSLLFVWVTLFLRYHLQEVNLQFKVVSLTKKMVVLVAASLVMILLTMFLGSVIRSMVADSQISFDVINFFTLNSYSVIGFIVLCCIAVAYFFLMQMILYLVNFIIKGWGYVLYMILPVAGFVILAFNLSSTFLPFNLSLLVWLLLFIFLLNYDYLTLLASKIVASRFIFWIFFFSISITSVIVFQNKAKELRTRKHFAENLSNKADPSGERMMKIVLTDFGNDFLSDVFNRLKNQNDNHYIKDSLINENFSGYLNKFDTKIYTFDEAQRSLFNEDSTTYNILNTVIETQGRQTDVPGLYYYDVSYDRFSYISRRTVTDKSGVTLGYVFIISNPKNYKSDALYPELFSKGNSNSIESSSLYAFAVYNNGKLSNSYNDYPFATTLSNFKILNGQFIIKKNNGYNELWYKANENKIIVIAKRDSFFIETITLFAYLFCSFVVLTALFSLLSIIIKTRFSFSKTRSALQLTIRNQVHGTVILISILSFLIIGVTTILFFISRYHSNNQEKLSRTIHVMETEVRKLLAELSISDDQVKVYDLVSSEKLDKTINRIAEIHAADINLYDLNGDLKVSSLPLPYEKGIVSTKMEPTAFYHLSKLKDVQYFREEEIGHLKYLSDYVPVRDETGKEYAYLNIPYFESQSKLQEEISNFLVTIINLNAFIFLIAGIVALFIANRITRSFSLISNKMKQVNIGQINEAIVWQRNDEIGGLVTEYNKMVRKLDTSAEMLARSEREGAWREMARQVAHEIKNPLTPMKLNLQYLQMAIDNNSPNVKDISVYVAKVLVEQIDHLSQIAGDFAQFANIGQTKNQLFDLNDSLKQVASLYSANENIRMDLKINKENLMILADKTQINRLFTNLLQNAVQSIPEDRNPQINISTNVSDNKVTIAIKDNGTGISADMISKIFTPNFTTKTSGTGLGLAMCKGIVEKANGRIWFETEDGISTTFFVELPLQ